MQKLEMKSLVTKLSEAKKALRNLASEIQDSNLRPNWRQHEDTETSIKNEDARHAEVTKELEHTRHELHKLKRNMARVLKEKRHAERASKASNSKRLTLVASVELINKEIQELKSKAVTDERLEGEKQEFESVKGEGFKFMTSMDAIRDELNHVRYETEQYQKTEQKLDSIVETLNSKILKAKAKLESLTSLESKTNTVASDLGVTLQQLRSETETLNKEEDLITEEIENTKSEIRKTEHEIEVIDEQLEVAIKELKAIKSSDSKALRNLRNQINRTMEARASMKNSVITITEFEYEYLTRKAGGAVEVADKKIVAAQAWVEALNANENELLMKIETIEREISKLSIEPGPEASAEGAGLGERVVASGRRSMYRVGSKTGVKRVRLQKFRSSTARNSLRRDKVTSKLGNVKSLACDD